MPRANEAGIIAAWARRGRRLEVVGAGTTVWEDGTGDPAVCLHGVPSSAFLYRKVLPELAERGRRGVTFQPPGPMEPFARRGIRRGLSAHTAPVAFERLMRLQGVATAVPASELRAYVPLLKRKDGGGAFLRTMRGFERSEAFERRILAALASRNFPAQVLWGEQDPTLKLDPYAEHVHQALAVETVTRLRGKHFVPEDAPQEIAHHVSRLIDSADGAG